MNYLILLAYMLVEKWDFTAKITTMLGVTCFIRKLSVRVLKIINLIS